jgi:soluble lytic murein transglycosylase-like protein
VRCAKPVLAGLLILFGPVAAIRPLATPAPLPSPTQLRYEAAKRIVVRVMHANGCSDRFAEPVARAAVDNNLSPRVVAAVVFVESSCNPDAISSEHAVGLMQVNGRVWHYSTTSLRDPEVNVQVGSRILREYIRRYGLREGLHHYNGVGDPSMDYSNRVIEACYAVPAR